ncbi:bestrophin family ion channel, partial [Pedobacter sp.]|uniref:bestrophin family ion channel n=1 Tax=Pedobacter sp. TaxID=1411316 RepID=UPI003C3416AF
EFQRFYNIPEKRNTLEAELIRYIAMEEIDFISSKSSRSAQLLSLQSKALADIFSQNKIAVLPYADMQKTIREFFILQGKSEKIKNSPYPRQYAIVNTILVKSFCFLLPYGMLREFDKLNEAVSGFMQGNMIWLTIPFSVLISWMYTSLGQVGESTENPFEGNANDVPISAISRIIEIDLLEMIDEHDIPKYPHPVNEIII